MAFCQRLYGKLPLEAAFKPWYTDKKKRRFAKMQKILLVIDMQNDFIDGALGTPEAVAIVDKVDRTSWAQSSIGKVYNVNKEDK